MPSLVVRRAADHGYGCRAESTCAAGDQTRCGRDPAPSLTKSNRRVHGQSSILPDCHRLRQHFDPDLP